MSMKYLFSHLDFIVENQFHKKKSLSPKNKLPTVCLVLPWNEFHPQQFSSFRVIAVFARFSNLHPTKK